MGKGTGKGEGKGAMLQAKKSALQATLTENVVELQNTELMYFYNNFSSISSIAAILGGFAFSGLCISTTFTGWLAEYDKDTKRIIIMLYYTFTSLAIGFCLLTCIICTALNVRGPGLALRGPEGSLKRAVDTMRKYQKHVNWILAAGIFCFHITAMMYGFLMVERCPTVVVMTLVLLAFLVGMIKYIVAIWQELRIPSDDLQHGGFGLGDFQNLANQTSGAGAGGGGRPMQNVANLPPGFSADDVEAAAGGGGEPSSAVKAGGRKSWFGSM